MKICYLVPITIISCVDRQPRNASLWTYFCLSPMHLPHCIKDDFFIMQMITSLHFKTLQGFPSLLGSGWKFSTWSIRPWVLWPWNFSSSCCSRIPLNLRLHSSHSGLPQTYRAPSHHRGPPLFSLPACSFSFSLPNNYYASLGTSQTSLPQESLPGVADQGNLSLFNWQRLHQTES